MNAITVYRITGRQLFFRIPESYCRECDLSVAAAKEVQRRMREKGVKVEVTVRPWLNCIVPALLKGIWHPPGVVVNGILVSQGVVPSQKKIEAALRK